MIPCVFLKSIFRRAPMNYRHPAFVLFSILSLLIHVVKAYPSQLVIQGLQGIFLCSERGRYFI